MAGWASVRANRGERGEGRRERGEGRAQREEGRGQETAGRGWIRLVNMIQ
jgi:hypothetical protein